MNLTFIGYTWGKYLLDIAKNFKNLNISFIYPHEIDEETITHERLLKLLEDADGIVIDLRGGGRAEELIYKSLKELYDIKKVIIVFLGSPRLLSLAKLGKFTLKGFLEKRNYPLENISEPLSITERIKKIQKIIEFTGKILPISVFKDAKNYVHALKYLTFPCEKNYLNFLKLIGHYLGLPYQDIRPPKEIPEYGIYHPDLGIFTNIKEYLNKISLFVKKDIEKLPKFGILFYGGIHFQQNINLIKELIKVFDNVICIPVYTNGIQNLDAIQKFFFFEEKPLVSGILSLLWFRLNGGPFGGKSEPTLKLLKKLKVPLFNPVVMYRREIKKWQESDYGLSPIEVIGAVIWPEMDGSIEPIPVAGLIELEEEKTKFKEVFPIIDRLEKIKYRVENWFSLQTKKNEEKRVALIIYNYPPGEENLGKAAYLDVFKSVEVLLEVLQKEGYRVELPENFNLVKILEQFAVFNSPKWVSLEKMYFKCFKMSLEDWSCYLKNFPLKVFDELINTWGEPPGRIMVYRNEILIPCIELGNVLIGIQPARPPLSLEDSKRIAHDKTKPPHHQYIAFYKWLEVVWKADVVIHVGTHGLAEFTKGKEIGLSKDCFPDLLIGNIPHLYFYHVLNTSEATIAKRRFYGTLISYNSPPYTTAGLYEELLNLEDYLNEYEEALQLDVGRAKVLEEKIKKLANKLNFYFETIDELHDQLYHLKRSIIPKGLHILGENYKEKELLEFVTLFSRYDRGEIKSLNRIIAESKGLKYEEVLKNSKLLAQIEEIAYRVIEAYFQDKSSLEKIIKSKEVQAEIEKTLNFAFTIGKSFINNQKEIENFILGLEGKFIEPSVGGDVIRNFEALPTGRNLYQFDPNKIPSEAAYIRGFEIAKNTLEVYLKLKKTYPETVGIVLWGFETTQTQGETIAQILSYLGVKIVRRYGSWYPELEIIPLEKLGRPRIDCHITICGFFREMFPNVINLLDKAFNLVSDLDEPFELNYVKKHTLENLQHLKESEILKDWEEERLKRIACGRIFGPSSSEYGTKMLQLIEDSVWEKEEDLVTAYKESMNYLYIENFYGFKSNELFKKNLKRIDLISQIRSSNDYEVTDLDHYFEFFGGLSKSVEVEKGIKPIMLISDTTRELILTENLDKAVEHGIRARLLNPKWIKEMLKHKAHGAQKIADIVENLLGWSATTGVVKNWIWNEIANKFVLNEQLKKDMMENNRWAYLEVLQRLLEANRRGYWQANEEVINQIKNTILEIEGVIEEKIDESF